ncbi:unnamed protein product [Durusdinium trenchii]|uniref:NADAR domain-containing protein n=1 Tax=Durusdinium trenchii TaxID=1381693 RepID=A0ABP0M7J3_9DINO
MGGPCRIAEPGKPHTRAPPCTDNFQVRKFMFDGREWESVEQCYQAMKFNDRSIQEKLRSIKKKEGDKDSKHGMDVWNEGQRYKSVRKDWDAVKVEMMYRANLAKYMQHRDLQEELLSTGHVEMVGAPSTGWKLKSGATVNWSFWNGRIQMRIREELRPEGEQKQDLVDSLVKEFEAAGVGSCCAGFVWVCCSMLQQFGAAAR